MDYENVTNKNVFEMFVKTEHKISQYDKISVSISGGSDSDVLLDLVWRCDPDKKCKYVFFFTGLEYPQTLRHLDYLENRYNIKIERLKSKYPIPYSVKHYGVPFISKDIAGRIAILQNNNFQFEDKPFSELLEKYPNAKSALAWWCNQNKGTSAYCISQQNFLKEFMIENPPSFPISQNCCKYSKKLTIHEYDKQNEIELDISGVRKSEGGVRAIAYESCFSEYPKGEADKYRPLFFMTDSDKKYYEKEFNIVHSELYTEWGMKRTGCVGCPFGTHNLKENLEMIKEREPKLYKACYGVFGEAYEYFFKYKEFSKRKLEEEKKYKEIRNQRKRNRKRIDLTENKLEQL